MRRTLVLIHTLPPLVAESTRLAAEALPGVRLLHLLDEPLLEHIRAHGPGAQDRARLAAHLAEAIAIGADAVLVTCSTLSPLLDQLPPAPIPVIPIDGAMVAEAVRLGTRIAVLATNPTTLEPTRQLLEREAARAGRTLQLRLILVEGALERLLAGDAAAHDARVAEAVRRAALPEANAPPAADVVLLAQASMARAAALLPAQSLPVPLLTSPALALRQVAHALAALPEGTPA